MKAGFYSPLPPARSGVADYSAALLRAMRGIGSIEPNPAACDVAVYQLGNNQLHREIYERALREPGVAVLHDAVLQHFFLGSLTEENYIAEFTHNYGAWSADLAQRLWRERARSAIDPRYFRYPMLRRIAEVSRAIIVHNPGAAAIVRTHAPSASIHEIPHFFHYPSLPPMYEVERLRAAMGVGSRTLIGVFGHLRESKRILPILRAFATARRSADIALLVAGEFVSSDLERAAEPLMRSDGVIRVGYTAEADFWLHAAAVDACINLRYPPAGETSGIAIRLMGVGKPLILTAGPEVSRIPKAACLRVDAGASEEDTLVDYMVWLARYPEDARAIGRNAAEHIRQNHGIERATRLYWEVLTRCCYDVTKVS